MSLSLRREASFVVRDRNTNNKQKLCQVSIKSYRVLKPLPLRSCHDDQHKAEQQTADDDDATYWEKGHAVDSFSLPQPHLPETTHSNHWLFRAARGVGGAVIVARVIPLQICDLTATGPAKWNEDALSGEHQQPNTFFEQHHNLVKITPSSCVAR